MRIVVDTNVVASGIFFAGNPGRIVDAICRGEVKASASTEIVDEYTEVIERLTGKLRKAPRFDQLAQFMGKLDFVSPSREVAVCRDPDDDKFISCAVEAKALYIVSGDKDLLVLGSYEDIEIVDAAEFCERYL